MIDVTGRDGRIHSFADGTSQAQIDAALNAIYGVPAAPSYDALPDQAQPSRGPSDGPFSMVQILGGALALAVIAILAMLAMMMGRDKTPTNVVETPNAGAATILPADQMPLTPVPTGPTVTPEVFAGYVATQQGGNVTVRAQAQPTGLQVTKLPHGAPVSVTGSLVMPDGLWRQVNIGGVVGYVKGEFVSQTQPAAIAKAPVTEAKMIPREFWGFATTKSSNSVNMRASPSTTAQVTRSIPAGAYVYVVGEQGAWYLIEWQGKRGWTNSSYISPEEPD